MISGWERLLWWISIHYKVVIIIFQFLFQWLWETPFSFLFFVLVISTLSTCLARKTP
jgi:hypothetical protein